MRGHGNSEVDLPGRKLFNGTHPGPEPGWNDLAHINLADLDNNYERGLIAHGEPEEGTGYQSSRTL